ncbi:helicase associated domain-containing protein, partial [Streptomyces sp. SID4982]|uniref:helicase associated domain-containing protein n=1 Tax=Streptomyces sp. SID4982 TaxID=2690291 RepID=UPI001F386D36
MLALTEQAGKEDDPDTRAQIEAAVTTATVYAPVHDLLCGRCTQHTGPAPSAPSSPHAPAADGSPPAATPARRLRGHSLQAERAFAQGLAQARAFADAHGSLAAVARTTLQDGYPLGQWLANQRNRRRTDRHPLPAARAQALAAIDPWWNPPWHLTWQRHYYRARDAAVGRPENGFRRPRRRHRALAARPVPRLRPAPPRPAAPPHVDRPHRPDGPRSPGPSRRGHAPQGTRHASRAQAHHPPPRHHPRRIPPGHVAVQPAQPRQTTRPRPCRMFRQWQNCGRARL